MGGRYCPPTATGQLLHRSCTSRLPGLLPPITPTTFFATRIPGPSIQKARRGIYAGAFSWAPYHTYACGEQTRRQSPRPIPRLAAYPRSLGRPSSHLRPHPPLAGRRRFSALCFIISHDPCHRLLAGELPESGQRERKRERRVHFDTERKPTTPLLPTNLGHPSKRNVGTLSVRGGMSPLFIFH
jgi:hypothetical protein